nr:hypothetical protein [Tanacetum cinerariifolium]
LINETLVQEAAKRNRLNEEAEDVKELKQHLEIVPDEHDDVYIEATPLVRLQVEEQSEMSLELIRFTRQQLQEGQHN